MSKAGMSGTKGNRRPLVMIFPAFLDHRRVNAEVRGFVPVGLGGSCGFGWKKCSKGPILVMSQYGQSCPLVRLDRSNRSKPQKWGLDRALFLMAAEFRRKRGHDRRNL